MADPQTPLEALQQMSFDEIRSYFSQTAAEKVEAAFKNDNYTLLHFIITLAALAGTAVGRNADSDEEFNSGMILIQKVSAATGNGGREFAKQQRSIQ